MGQPLLLKDVSDAQLFRFNVPFKRPRETGTVFAAALGNGFGDVATYVALQYPPEEAARLFESLKTDSRFASPQELPEPTYLDQMSQETATRLWPGHELRTESILECDGTFVAHVPGSQDIHVYSFAPCAP